MPIFTLALACLVCLAHGNRIRMSREQSQSSSYEKGMSSHNTGQKMLARLIWSSTPAAAWQLSGKMLRFGLPLSNGAGNRCGSRLLTLERQGDILANPHVRRLGRPAVMEGNGSWTDALRDAIRSVSGRTDYELGDFTKETIVNVANGTKEAVTSFTGKENYEFGDITRKVVKDADDVTRKVIKDADSVIAELRDEAFKSIGEELMPVMRGLSREQQRNMRAAVLRIGTVVVLSYNFAASLVRGCMLVFAWASSCHRTGLSPFASADSWTVFLSSHATTCWVFEPLLLPLRVLLAVFILSPYAKLVGSVQNILMRSPFRSKPVLNRVLALAAVFLLGNGLVVGLVMVLGVAAASLITGVPLLQPLMQ